MYDPTDLYRLDGDAPELTDPVLLYHFEGFVDAGGAGRLALGHLMAELDHRVVATFDVDRLIDYRSPAGRSWCSTPTAGSRPTCPS